MLKSIAGKALCMAGAFSLLAGFTACQKTPIEPEPELKTNVAEIRSLVLAGKPGANTDTELSSSLRAKTLTGIVVSDKEGGNCQPFIVSIVDDSDKAGAGLALVISEENNSFAPGDIISVSLSDATAQFYNGLLQVATGNAPEFEEKAGVPEPIVISASELADYESQYVKIENTQPVEGESGTWNSDSNKGNVTMETEDGGTWTLRTMQGASYAAETIPEDKSGSVAGIAGVYNSTLQISPRNLDDIQLTADRFTVSSTEATIAEVLEGGEGKSYTVSGAVVTGRNERGVLVEQEGSSIYVFLGGEHEFTAGDVVSVSGRTESRNGLLQFGEGSTLEKTGTEEYVYPEPETFTATEIDAYMSAPEVKYVTYTGYVYKSGNYTNVDIDGTSYIGSLDYMTEDFRDKYNGHVLEITGWLFGAYSSYMYTMPVEVVDLGEYEEEVPEGAIYYNTFDKEVSSETFGDGGSWPYLDQFDGWRNEKGSGAAGVTYDFEHMSVRSNQSSEGYLSTYEGSGKNNIFFSTAPNHFTIGNIAVSGRDFKLTFGAQRYSQGGNNTFLKSNFEVRVSTDGTVWSQALDYDFAVEDDPGQWRLAELDFTLPEDASTLYIRFEALTGSVNRIDDVLLTAGEGGQEAIPGGETELELSTIAEVLAGPVDTKYRIEGQVIATHTRGFLVKDDSGIILVFKRNVEEAQVGNYVSVTGPTTEYGKLAQFDSTSEVTLISTGSWTNPTPEEWGASDFDSYVAMQTPTIEYVTYTGLLTSYRDNNWQWHYNVGIEGTDVQGTVSYPDASINIESLVDREVIVCGWVIGVTGEDEYISTMVTSVEPTEEDLMPDEDEALTVSKLYSILKGLEDGAGLGEYVAVKGYVAANNEGGNLYRMISITDNSGLPESGLILYGQDFVGDDLLPVGTEVIVSLSRAEFDNYNGLYEIKNGVVFKTGDVADEMIVPVISAAEAGQYLCQYVTVKDLTPAESATTWVVGGETTNTTFSDASGDSIDARATSYAEFADLTIEHVTADLSGVMQVYNGTYQLFPTSNGDVAGFTAE